MIFAVMTRRDEAPAVESPIRTGGKIPTFGDLEGKSCVTGMKFWKI